MPGWAGQAEPRTDGSQEYAWHCAPFTEGGQYGIEVRKDGKLVFDGDFGPCPDNSGDLMWPPFRSFGQDYLYRDDKVSARRKLFSWRHVAESRNSRWRHALGRATTNQGRGRCAIFLAAFGLARRFMSRSDCSESFSSAANQDIRRRG